MFLLQFCIFTKITRIVPTEAVRIFKHFQVSVMCYLKITVTSRQALKWHQASAGLHRFGQEMLA